MPAYYNEIDPYAAQWLRDLIAAGHIAAGDVDDRSIEDVSADNLKGYEQCHFFAGIGGWSLALRLAGWPDDRPVWTGSCPCQPLSSAGQRKGHADERHLWPAFQSLIAERRPATVFGEQVASKDGREWLAGVRADMEQLGYACGAADLPAACVGAPHIRQRLWWVADTGRDRWRTRAEVARCHDPKSGERRIEESIYASGCGGDSGMANAEGQRRRVEFAPDERSTNGEIDTPADASASSGLAHADGRNAGAEGEQRRRQQRQQPEDGGTGGGLGDATSPGLQGKRRLEGTRGEGHIGQSGPSSCDGFWDTAESIPCGDSKARRIEPGTFPLAHGVPGRVGRLRAYGNAVVPQIAVRFIEAADVT